MYKILSILLSVACVYGHIQKYGNVSVYKSSPEQSSVAGLTTATTSKSIKTNRARHVRQTDERTELSCTTENGEVGECVRYYLCSNVLNTDGSGVIDIRWPKRFRRQVTNSSTSSSNMVPCESYLDTCCVFPDQTPFTRPILIKPDRHQPKNESCGFANPEGVGVKTVSETDGQSKYGEFPWMVAILNVGLVNDSDPDGKEINEFVGGGSLIHLSAVLTAGYYSSVVTKLKVRAGEWDTQTTKEIYPFQDRQVESIVVHKNFNKENLFYNIAILFLKTPMDLAPNVGVICLPPAQQPVPAGTRCIIMGWGKDKFGKNGQYQKTMKKVNVPVVDRLTCENRLRTTRLGRTFQLHKSFICAGGVTGKDACTGDGGSPLVCPYGTDKNRYVQSGIVAWGIGCGESGIPGIYTDVSYFSDWIDNKLSGRDGCFDLSDSVSSPKNGKKAFDKCIEYQERYVFPCEKWTVSEVARRGNYCEHETVAANKVDSANNYYNYVVSLGEGEEEYIRWKCNGIIISDRFILTVASCLKDSYITFVYLGGSVRIEEIDRTRLYRVKNTIIHPKFNSISYRHDIALLEVEELYTIQLNHHIRPACLDIGTISDYQEAMFISRDVWIPHDNPNHLIEVELSRESQETCDGTIRQWSLFKDSSMCYTDLNQNATFRYDWGCPLQVKTDNIKCMDLVIGIRSFEVSAQSKVFTRVSRYINWIESVVWP